MLICCIRLLCDWLFHLFYHIIYICNFIASYLFLVWYNDPYGVVLCCYQKRFYFSLKVSLSWQRPSFIVWYHSYYYYYSFSYQRKLIVFHSRLSESKSPQVSRTLLSILVVFNNAVVWMVSTRPPTSKSSRPFNNPLVTVPKAPITIIIIIIIIRNFVLISFV